MIKLGEERFIRQYGDTGGNILIAIGTAIKSPGVSVSIETEEPLYNKYSRDRLQHRARCVIKSLELINVKVKIINKLVWITSIYYGEIEETENLFNKKKLATKEDWDEALRIDEK